MAFGLQMGRGASDDASAQPNEPGVIPELGGNDAAHDLDGLLLEVSRAAARHRDLKSLL